MKFWSALTPEEMSQIVSFIENGDEAVLSTDVPSKFLDLFSAFQRRMATSARTVRLDNERLRRRIACCEAKRNEAVEAGDFDDLNIDSVTVARAVLHCTSLRNARMSYSKLMSILYDIYAVWLASHRQRVFLEHPVAQESGPWFWRVKNNVRTLAGHGRESLEEIRAVNPGVAVVVERAANKYCDQSEADLSRWLQKSEPYRLAHKDTNGGKWNKEISDTRIYHWKMSQLGK